MKHAVLAALFALLLPALTAGDAALPLSTSPRSNLWIADGIGDMEVVGDLLYVSVASRVGPLTGLAAPVDIDTGSLLPAFPRVDGDVDAGVLAAAPDGSGGWYLAGAFTSVDGEPRANLAHVLAGSTLDPAWAPVADGAIHAVTVSGGVVYIGGAFTAINGIPRAHLAALDSATGAVLTWNPGADGPVYTLSLSGAVVYAGGGFTQIGGQPRSYAAALDLTTGLATWWNPLANGPVYALVPANGCIYAGGYFSQIGWSGRANIAALNPVTGQAESWAPTISGANAFVSALVVTADTVYAGGYFDYVNGVTCSNLVFLNVSNSAARLCPSTDGNGPDALALSAGTLYVGGQFAQVSGQPRANLVALDTATGQATGWDPAPDGPVKSLALSGDVLYAGGHFRSAGMLPRVMAALDLATGQATDWAPQIEGSGGVYTSVISGTTAYVGGWFSDIGGEERSKLAALDLTTGLATGWNPGAYGWTDGSVNVMARIGNTIYIGGDFFQVGGQSRSRLAALDAVTGQVLPWNPNPDDPVLALIADGNVVYAGGEFYNIGGMLCHCVAALHPVSGAVIPWNPPDLGCYQVTSLAVSNGMLYAGGQFSTIGGVERHNLAAINLSTRQVTGWNPNVSTTVSSLAPGDGVLYISGHFSEVGGQPRNRLAAIDTVTGLPSAWNPSLQYYPAYVMAAAGDALYIGGGFDFVGNDSRPNLAAFDPAASAYSADVLIAKTDGLASVLPGASLTYTITVSNAGPDAAGVTIADAFPAAFTDFTWFCRAGSFSRCNQDGGSLDIDIGLTVGPGDSVIIVATGTVDPAARGALVNTAVLTPPPGVTDLDLTDNSATDTTFIGGDFDIFFYLPIALDHSQ